MFCRETTLQRVISLVILLLILLIPQASALPQVSTAKNQYCLSEKVTIMLSGVSETDIIKIISAENIYKLMGETGQNPEFIPQTEGSYLLVIESSGTEVASASFTVIGSTACSSAPETNIPTSTTGDISSEIKIRNSLNQDTDFEFEINPIKDNKRVPDEQFFQYSTTEKFDLEIIAHGKGINSIILKNAVKSSQGTIDIGIEDVDNEKVSLSNRKTMKTFAIDPTQVRFDTGTVTAIASGTELWKCKDWIFATQTCTGRWQKIMDLTPGRQYSFTIDALDPGFTETTPSTGTPDTGNAVNIASATFTNGAFTDTQSDNNVYWAQGVSNGGGSQADPVGYLNISYNASTINLSNRYQLTNISIDVRYCHSNDISAPSTCAALSAGTTINSANIDIYNYSSGSYFVLGTLATRNGVEGLSSYNLPSDWPNFMNPTNGYINIRIWHNITISNNGVDAVLAVDYAPLTVTFDRLEPSISFTSPSDTSGNIISRNYLFFNTTSNDTNLKNITTYVYNSSGDLVRNSTQSASTLTGLTFFSNFTGLADDLYYFNATACDVTSNCNSTTTRNITIDTGSPVLTFSSPTDNSDTYVNRAYIQINATANDPTLQNITLFIYNASFALLYNETTTQDSLFRNQTGLSSQIYFYNSTACDLFARCSQSIRRNVTVDLIYPTVQFVNPTSTSGTVSLLGSIQANASASDTYYQNITINIYDSTGSIVNTTFSNSSTYLYVNYSFSEEDMYYFNATACDRAGNCNTTQSSNYTKFSYTIIDGLTAGTREAMLVYGEGTVTTPRYRIWNGTNFGVEQSANDIGGTIEWLRLKSNPIKSEYALVATGTLNDINMQIYGNVSGNFCWSNGTACNTVIEFETASSTVDYLKADVAYESLTGEIIVAYIDTSTNPDVARYRIWNGSMWSVETTVPQTRLTGNAEQVRMAERPDSNEIALLITDANDDANVIIWNGTAWVCEPTGVLSNSLSTAAYQTIDLAYEQLSGDLFIALTHATSTEINYTTKPANTCTYTTTGTTALSFQAESITLNPQYNTNYVIIAVHDNGVNQVQSIVWNGTGMATASAVDAATLAEAIPNQLEAVGWAGSSRTGVMAYSDSINTTSLSYMLYNKNTNSWTGTATGFHTNGTGGITNFSNSERVMKTYSYIDEKRLMLLVKDSSAQLWAKYFDTTLNYWQDADEGTALETTASSLNYPSFDFAWRRYPNPPRIHFVEPTDNSSMYLPRNYIQINVSVNDTNPYSLTVILFNSSGSLVNINQTSELNMFLNLTGKSDGLYYFNATICDMAGNCNVTETRNITLDTINPNVTLLAPVTHSYPGNVVFEFLVNDTNLQNCTLYNNATGAFSANSTINLNNSNLVTNITVPLGRGLYVWNVLCCDMAGTCSFDTSGGPANNGNYTLNITYSDMELTRIQINVNDSYAKEGMNITINATVSNIGPLNITSNITVQFFDGSPFTTGVQILDNITIPSLASGQVSVVNVSIFIPRGGPINFYAVVDPQLSINGSINETNENNNIKNQTLHISGYHIFHGVINSTVQLKVTDDNNSTFYYNTNRVNTTGNIIIASNNETINFLTLQAIGRTAAGGAGSNDFSEADSVLNMTGYKDSLSKMFTEDTQVPLATRTVTLFNQTISDVPVINSTNTTNFVTGMLWDTSDGGSEYDGSQDLIIISPLNYAKQGAYGTYDYEIKLPVDLENYNGGNAAIFYSELVTIN
jgi:hypothetical protein